MDKKTVSTKTYSVTEFGSKDSLEKFLDLEIERIKKENEHIWKAYNSHKFVNFTEGHAEVFFEKKK